MDKNYTDEFFRAMYNSELEEKHKLDSADSLLVAVVLALSTVGIYYLRILPAACSCGVAGQAFIGLAVPFAVLFLCAYVLMGASLWPRERAYIGPPREWSEFVDGSNDYYAKYHDREEINRRTADDLANCVRQKYADAAETNFNYNIKRMGYQTRGKQFAMLAGFFVLLNAFPTYLVQCPKTGMQKTEVAAFPDIQTIPVISPQSKGQSHERQESPPTAGGPAKADSKKAGATEERPGKKQ